MIKQDKLKNELSNWEYFLAWLSKSRHKPKLIRHNAPEQAQENT